MAAKDARSTFDLQIKLLMIGDSGVGKTCLLLRYANDSFSPTFITTIGIDFKIKTVCLDNTVVKLQIWDTAGQERFRTITTSYFRGAQGILLVYDVCDRGSFENISNWIGQIEQHADINVTKVLIGNKCDADPSKIQVTEAEGQALADQYGIKFFLTSAKNNLNVTEAFESVARDVMNRVMSMQKPGGAAGAKSDAPQAGGGGVALNKEQKPAAGGCC
jgi:Ras-related protein Rab-8A